MSTQGNTRDNEVEVLKRVISGLLEFVGLAHCAGYKCRLPHCDSCNFDEDADAASERLQSLQFDARALLGKKP